MKSATRQKQVNTLKALLHVHRVSASKLQKIKRRDGVRGYYKLEETFRNISRDKYVRMTRRQYEH